MPRPLLFASPRISSHLIFSIYIDGPGLAVPTNTHYSSLLSRLWSNIPAQCPFMIETLTLYSCTAAKSLQEMLPFTEGEITVFSGLVCFDATGFAHFRAVAPYGWPRGDCSDYVTEHLLAFIWMTDLKQGSISWKDCMLSWFRTFACCGSECCTDAGMMRDAFDKYAVVLQKSFEIC